LANQDDKNKSPTTKINPPAEGKRITGLSNMAVEVYENVPFEKSDMVSVDRENGAIHFKLFPSGSVVALK
jgi:hypothetical protein